MQMTYLQRTPSQRIFDAVSKIDMMGSNYSPQALVNLYTENLKMSSKSEKFTVNFLVCSQVVYERALNVPDLLQIVMVDEQSPQPLWQTVSTLHATVAREYLISNEEALGDLLEVILALDFLGHTSPISRRYGWQRNERFGVFLSKFVLAMEKWWISAKEPDLSHAPWL